MEKKILGILDCDDLASELIDDYDCYSEMFQMLFRHASSSLVFRRYHVSMGQLPADPKECDAYLISGSKAGVYDDLDWLRTLKPFIREAYVQEVKQIGICFGHQLLADTLGGKARKSSKGWGVGAMISQRVTTGDWMVPPLDKLRLLYSHQDQVVELPLDAECLFESEFCPFAAYQIPGRVLSFQGHPEFTKDYCSRLMLTRKHLYAPGQYEQALASLKQDLDEGYVAKWIINFLLEA